MAMTILTLVFYPSFRDSGLDEAFGNMPESVQKMIGSLTSFKTITGYLDQQIFALRMPLLGIILSIVVFSGLTVGDEQKGVTETHLTMPISRTKLLLQKLFAGLLITAVASIGIVVGAVVALALIHEHVALSYILTSTLACWLISTCFGLVAFFVGSATGRRGLTIGLASGFAFGSYLLTSLAQSVSQLEQASKFSLFHYYGNGRISLGDAWLLLAIAFVLVVLGVLLFNRRDLRT